MCGARMTECAVHVVQSGLRHFLPACLFADRLLGVLRLVQCHWALCAGWSHTDVGHPCARDGVVSGLDEALASCRAASPAQSDGAFVDEIEAGWQALLATRGQLSAEMAFLRHSRLIEQILGRIGLLAEQWPGLDREQDRLVSDYARQLPALAECLGQIRGMCCGVAAQGGCTAFKRTRLLFLCSSAQALLVTAYQCYRGIAPPVEALVARTATESLVHIVRAGFLRERVDYPVAAFYKTATESIDTVFAWIERIGADLKDSVGVNQE